MKGYVLTNSERETTITYDDGSKEARVYTCNQAMMRKLRTMASNPCCTLHASDECSETYIIPKSWVKIQMPRVYTDEDRVKMATALNERLGRTKQEGE